METVHPFSVAPHFTVTTTTCSLFGVCGDCRGRGGDCSGQRGDRGFTISRSFGGAWPMMVFSVGCQCLHSSYLIRGTLSQMTTWRRWRRLWAIIGEFITKRSRGDDVSARKAIICCVCLFFLLCCNTPHLSGYAVRLDFLFRIESFS